MAIDSNHSPRGGTRSFLARARAAGLRAMPPRTKVVVRNLPPDLPEEAFKDAVDSAGFRGRYGWFDYVQGKAKTKLTTPSIAYVNFADEASLFDFSGSFGGRRFADDKGKEWRIAVEFAPYQKCPRVNKPRRDRREGTIEKDRDFQVRNFEKKKM